MACPHTRAKPTQDGNVICPDCGQSLSRGVRLPNSFAPVPAGGPDLTAISIGVGFGGVFLAAYLALGLGGFVGAVVLTGRLLTRAAGF